MGIDFLNVELVPNKCMACEISAGNYIPPGGIVYFDEFFFVHQDPLVAIPGFFIISPHRHIFSIDEMTPLELNDLGRVIAVAEKVVKEVTKVEYVTVIQEEKVREGHLHIWLFPWHDFLKNDFQHSLSNIRLITERYKKDMSHREETIAVAGEAVKLFQNSNAADSEFDFHGRFLCDVDFSGRNLANANFRGAVLKRCNFENCDLSFANFDEADLYKVSFCNSILYSTTYKNADLTRADFRGARIYGIKIFGADLTHTIFDATVKEEHEKNYSKAEDIYNTIKRAYAENGNKEEAAKYYYKQCVARRKQQKGLRRFFNWLIADELIGYGEKLSRCLIISTFVIIAFAVYYFQAIGYTDFSGCLFSSLIAFFGFEPIVEYVETSNISTAYAIEQLLGYLFIALALIGITRKIVRD